jgi:signal peptidase I
MKTLRDVLETVLIALVISILVRSFVVERFLVDGPSMEPTMWTDQSLMVLKIAYRFAEPKRGDIVVFRYPYNPEKDYVKRVIAVGGDTIEMRLGRVYVNGQLKEEPYVQYPGFFNMNVTTVPEGTIFVMGDNRTNSEDSRMFGPVSLSNVKGKAVFRIWPLKSIGVLR